ncbi:uncharacterized protein LOC130895644 [Diorhabda carinulata]|uniref:uncharacterized protein LOC130895644 n=1 Tax=Diorhabda carinulata TaxID=1163345 RepID=UPI0025A167E0|nr:uncharacterized protein LOC130895644 [Diorhabda carinulata]
MDFFEVKMTEQDDPFIDLKKRITFWILKKHCFIYYVRRFLIIAHVISLSLFFFRSDGLTSIINIFLQTPEGSAAITMPLTGVIVTMTTLFQACLHGETLKLSSMKLYETLCETDWIQWNESNSKTLFIMIQVSATPMKISFLSISNIDFDLLKNFYKWSYPMVSLIMRGTWNKDESLENINI